MSKTDSSYLIAISSEPGGESGRGGNLTPPQEETYFPFLPSSASFAAFSTARDPFFRSSPESLA